MHSHRFIKENIELIKQKLALRGVSEEFIDQTYKAVDDLLETRNREKALNEERNILISQDAKGNAERIRTIKQQLTTIKELISQKEKLAYDLVSALPNLPDKTLTDREHIVKIWGNIREDVKFNHKELCRNLDIVGFEEGVALSGSGFVVYKNKGARLYRALIEYTLKLNREKGYQERYLPVLLLPHCLYGTAQLPKFEEDLFKTEDGRYLSPTSESQLVNLYREQILPTSVLPLKLTANTNCFRAEAGAAGIEDSGIIRLHQFCKTELVVICESDDSYSILENMLKDATSILKALRLPFRIIQLPYDDLSFSSAKTYDIEVWFPSEGRYREISSISNTLSFQAMRARIRHKDDVLDKFEKSKYPHILNGSSLAIDRLFAAIIDNYQKDDGTVTMPRELVSFLGFEEIRN